MGFCPATAHLLKKERGKKGDSVYSVQLAGVDICNRVIGGSQATLISSSAVGS